MIVILCEHCRLCVRVMPSKITEAQSVNEALLLVGPQSGFWPDKFLCARCDQPAKGFMEDHVDLRVLELMEVLDLTPQEAFASFQGAGIPVQQVASIEQVQELLREKPIRKVHGASVKGGRHALVESLELWDGTIVFLAASPQGAVIYRIRPPSSYTIGALEESHGG